MKRLSHLVLLSGLLFAACSRAQDSAPANAHPFTGVAPGAWLDAPAAPLYNVRAKVDELLFPNLSKQVALFQAGDPQASRLLITAGKVIVTGTLRYVCDARVIPRPGEAMPLTYRLQFKEQELSVTFLAETDGEYQLDVMQEYRVLRPAAEGTTPAAGEPVMMQGFVNLNDDCPKTLRLRITSKKTGKVWTQESAPAQ